MSTVIKKHKRKSRKIHDPYTAAKRTLIAHGLTTEETWKAENEEANNKLKIENSCGARDPFISDGLITILYPWTDENGEIQRRTFS